MRQFLVLGASVFLFLVIGTVFWGCGGGGAVSAVASITLTPGAISLNRGATAQLTVQALDANNNVIAAPALTYNCVLVRVGGTQVPVGTACSVANSPISVSSNGLVCAGQWDANFINCHTTDSAGIALPIGTASITATASVNGKTITSSAVLVTDHERIDSVTVAPTGGPLDFSTPDKCASQGSTAQFSLEAFSNDPNVCKGAGTPCPIPADTIGAVNWLVSPPPVAIEDANVKAATDPIIVTAATPGQGAVVGSVGVAGSLATGSATFTTCPVASIHVQKSSSDPSIAFTAPIASTVTLTPVVVDSKSHSLSSTVGLSWFTSQPALTSVSLGTVGTIAPGTAEITAACLPPSCNVNFTPPRPIFSDNVVTANITGTVNSTVLVTTSTAPASSSSSNSIVPINTGTNTPGTALALPANAQVNSMVVTPAGNPVLLGTRCASGTSGPNGAACSGLLRFDPTATSVAAPVPTITGEVLATDGNRVVLADPDNKQTVIALAAGPSIERTVSEIPNASAAAFAIDGSKIYIVEGNQLFIYSPTLPLRNLPLSGTAGNPAPGVAPQQVALFATGAMAYVADSGGDDVIATCNDLIHSTVTVPHPPGPTHLAAVPNASAMVDANTPNIDEIDASANSSATAGACPPLITNTPTSHNFATSFTAKQLIVTPDSKFAIILSDQGVLVYDLTSKTAMPPIALSAGKPLSGAVTPDSASLYVGADDGRVHRVDLTKTPPTDAQSIAVTLCASGTSPCNPDFVALRQVATAVTLSSIAVTPANPSLSVGGTQQFTATGTFSDKTTRDMTNFVTWTSSNTNVAVIGPSTNIPTPGLAQALATGSTTITATSSGVSGSTTLTVK